jgi:hypothetical protein
MSEGSIFEACTAQVGDTQNVTGLLQCISDANQAVSSVMPTASIVRDTNVDTLTLTSLFVVSFHGRQPKR